MRIRSIVSLGVASLIIATMAARAEEAPKLKIPEVKIDAKAQKDAESKIKQAKDQSADIQKEQAKKVEGLKKEQTKKTEEIKKEAAKGSEQGQAMRKEHSKKWWQFGKKEPAVK
jgi:outer membrane biosynthesis protein TonB